MGVILSSLLGIFGSTLPDIFKFFQDKNDKAHEIAVMELQYQRDKEIGLQQAQAITDQADATTLTAALQTINTGNKFTDFLSGTVRPIATYLELALYMFSKLWIIITYRAGLEIPFIEAFVWTDFDKDLLAVIIGFWFGSRAFQKSRL